MAHTVPPTTSGFMTIDQHLTREHPQLWLGLHYSSFIHLPIHGALRQTRGKRSCSVVSTVSVLKKQFIPLTFEHYGIYYYDIYLRVKTSITGSFFVRFLPFDYRKSRQKLSSWIFLLNFELENVECLGNIYWVSNIFEFSQNWVVTRTLEMKIWIANDISWFGLFIFFSKKLR